MNGARKDLDELVAHYQAADERLQRYRDHGHDDDLREACKISCGGLRDLSRNDLFWAELHGAAAAGNKAGILPDTLDDLGLFASLEDELFNQTGKADVARKVVFDTAAAIGFLGRHPGPLEVTNLQVQVRALAELICEVEGEVVAAASGWKATFIKAGRFATRGVRVLAGAVETGYDAAAIVSGLLTPEHGLSLVSGVDLMWSGIRPCRD